MNPSPVLNVAIRAARAGGALAMRHFDRRDRLDIQRKGADDIVTNADIEVEKEIIHHLRKAYPSYGIMAEESPNSTTGDGWQWVIDPIDGTNNFIHGIAHFAISIALLHQGEVMLGVVHDPVMDEIFFSERGRGAFLNDYRIRVAPNHPPSQAFFATGFPLRHKEHLATYLESFQMIFLASRGIRRGGSAALDLAYTAAGRYDGFWEMRLAPWDIAAGTLLVQEAGGFVSDFKGTREFLATGDVIAGNPAMHAFLADKVKLSGLADL